SANSSTASSTIWSAGVYPAATCSRTKSCSASNSSGCSTEVMARSVPSPGVSFRLHEWRVADVSSGLSDELDDPGHHRVGLAGPGEVVQGRTRLRGGE